MGVFNLAMIDCGRASLSLQQAAAEYCKRGSVREPADTVWEDICMATRRQGARLDRLSELGKKLSQRAREESFRRLCGTLTGVKTGSRVAALTFDDGPDPEATPRILEVLRRHDAKGTFFMRGEAARANRQLVERIAGEGHLIGNHTWDHPSMPNIARSERARQLRLCSEALAPFGSRYFRPPYGHQSMASRLDALLLGYEVVGWTGHAFDYLDRSAEQIAQGLAEQLKSGAILLMHDALYPPITQAYADRRALIEGLAEFLTRRAGEYEFVTVAELLNYGPARRKSWLKPGDIDWLNALNDGKTRRYERKTRPGWRGWAAR